MVEEMGEWVMAGELEDILETDEMVIVIMNLHLDRDEVVEVDEVVVLIMITADEVVVLVFLVRGQMDWQVWLVDEVDEVEVVGIPE